MLINVLILKVYEIFVCYTLCVLNFMCAIFSANNNSVSTKRRSFMSQIRSISSHPLGKKSWRVRLQKSLRQYWPFYALFIPCLVCLIIFSYMPMYGVVLAFKDFKSKIGILGSPWADPLFKHFEELFRDPYFIKVMRNTVVISLLRLLIGFPAPLILALMLNELRGQRFKRSVQTIFYLPNFIFLFFIYFIFFIFCPPFTQALHHIPLSPESCHKEGNKFQPSNCNRYPLHRIQSQDCR